MAAILIFFTIRVKRDGVEPAGRTLARMRKRGMGLRALRRGADFHRNASTQVG